MTWCVLFRECQPSTDVEQRPEAEEMVVGISYCSHKSYGTPGESWQQYERQRLRGFVQKLPYIPPGAPKFPPLPGIPPPASQTPRKRDPTHHADGRTPNRPPAALTPSRSAPAKVRPSSRETSSNAKGKHPSTPTSSTISTPSSLGSMRSLRDACPPWEAHSQAFVVFEGSPPGLYTNWSVPAYLQPRPYTYICYVGKICGP